MLIEYGGKTDVGKVRTNNEDNIAVDESIGLCVVADGMGGANAGEVASKMATELITNSMRQIIARHDKNANLSAELVSGIKLANQAIFEAGKKYEQNKGMGTTVVTVLAQEKSHIIAWVGDSRIYLVRHQHIQQLSIDHSLVQEQITKGLLTPEQAEQSDFKNVLTRALGVAEKVGADVVEIPAFDDDYVILCSDGLTRMVTDEEMLDAVKQFQNPQDICDNLIKKANERGGKDNITVAIMHKKAESIWNKFIHSIVGT